MTEDEAKTKWCPFAKSRLIAWRKSDSERVNRIYSLGDGPDPRCIASACMAWRRQTVMIDRATNEPALPGVPAIGQLEERYSSHGHCGLGGAPQ